MKSILSAHNKQILNETNEQYECNCRRKNECPLDNKCLTPKIVYGAEVTNNIDEETKKYIGMAETPFKDRYRNHIKDFKNKKYNKSTELSKYIWQLKDNNKVRTVKWRIIKTVRSNVTLNYCKLCLMEKYYIINSLGDKNLLNNRYEFVSKCRHKNKLLIKSVKAREGVG